LNEEVRLIEFKGNLDDYIERIPVVLLPKKINWAKFKKGEVYQALMDRFNLNYAQIITVVKRASKRRVVQYENGKIIVKRGKDHG